VASKWEINALICNYKKNSQKTQREHSTIMGTLKRYIPPVRGIKWWPLTVWSLGLQPWPVKE